MATCKVYCTREGFALPPQSRLHLQRDFPLGIDFPQTSVPRHLGGEKIPKTSEISNTKPYPKISFRPASHPTDTPKSHPCLPSRTVLYRRAIVGDETLLRRWGSGEVGSTSDKCMRDLTQTPSLFCAHKFSGARSPMKLIFF